MSKTTLLKPYATMSQQEKMVYLKQVSEWNDEKYPRLCAIANAWEECDIKDYDEGLTLISAFQNSHDFITKAYRFDQEKRLTRLYAYMSSVREKTGLAKMTTRQANDPKSYRAIVPFAGRPNEEGVIQKGDAPTMDEMIDDVNGMRPEHVAQYFHLLSPELQLRAKPELLKELHIEMAHNKEMAINLQNQPGSSQSDIKHHITEVTRIFDQLQAIYADINKEMKQVNDAKNGIIPDSPAFQSSKKKKGEYTKAEIDAMPEGLYKTQCYAARVSANKRYINRSDVKGSDAYEAESAIRRRELQEWGELPADDDCAGDNPGEDGKQEVDGASGESDSLESDEE